MTHRTRLNSIAFRLVAGVAGAVFAVGLLRGANDIEAKSVADLPNETGAKGWSGSYEASYQFYTTPSPVLILAGDTYRNPLRYRLFTQTVSLRLPISRVVGRSFWRGQWEFNINMMGSVIIHGPESYFVGAGPGFRYNFLPHDSRWSPFVELRGFVGATDSSGVKSGQQQDLTFCYQLAVGTKYRIKPGLAVQIAVVDQHISNAYLTHPNYGFDVIGVNVGIHRDF